VTYKSNRNEFRGRSEEKQGESILWKSLEAGLTGRGEFDIIQSLSRPVRRQRVDDPFTHIVTLPKIDDEIQNQLKFKLRLKLDVKVSNRRFRC
jgi:hypothetical protein